MRNVIIIGRRREGKTTLAVHLALTSGKGIVIFDINSQVEIKNSIIVCELEGFHELMMLSSKERPRIIIYRPIGGAQSGALDAEFSEVAKVLWVSGHNYVFLVDEAHWLQTPQQANEMLETYIRMADSSVTLIQTVHTLSDTWTRGRSLASDIIMFQLTRSADLKAVQAEFGEDVSEQVKALPLHHYIHVDLDSHKTTKVDNPASWYHDLNKKEIKNESVYA